MASSLTLALLSHSPLLPQESPLPSDTFLAGTSASGGQKEGRSGQAAAVVSGQGAPKG